MVSLTKQLFICKCTSFQDEEIMGEREGDSVCTVQVKEQYEWKMVRSGKRLCKKT